MSWHSFKYASPPKLLDEITEFCLVNVFRLNFTGSTTSEAGPCTRPPFGYTLSTFCGMSRVGWGFRDKTPAQKGYLRLRC